MTNTGTNENRTIKIRYTSIDGFRQARSFKTLEAARQYAAKWVGEQDTDGGSYAVSPDGVGKVTWDGCSRTELFAYVEIPAIPLNKTTTFYTKGNDLFCRQEGLCYDHAHQHFGRVIETMDNITGDHPAGWGVFHIEGHANILFDEDHRFATRAAALAYAKDQYLGYLAYLGQDAN